MEECYFKVAGFSLHFEVTFPHGCFSRFLSCTNETKSRKASYMHFFFYPSRNLETHFNWILTLQKANA